MEPSEGDRNNNCTFCAQYIYKTETNFWWKNWGNKGNIISDVLLEDSKNLVIAGLGALTEGYILIIPKNHYLSIGALPEEYIHALSEIKAQIRYQLEVVYKQPVIFFEHGTMLKRGRGGSCIDHVHLHGFPSGYNFRQYLCQSFSESAIDSLLNLNKYSSQEIPYLFYEDQSGKQFVYTSQDPIPSQFIRRVWAQSLGQPLNWDWNVFVEETNVLATIKALAKNR